MLANEEAVAKKGDGSMICITWSGECSNAIEATKEAAPVVATNCSAEDWQCKEAEYWAAQETADDDSEMGCDGENDIEWALPATIKDDKIKVMTSTIGFDSDITGVFHPNE